VLRRYRNLTPFLRRQLDFFFRTLKREQGGFRICISSKLGNETWAQVLVELQPHETKRRSRAAAKARQALTSSAVKSGKSANISFSVMPPASYSSTSYTVILVPLMQGLPLRTPGVTVILSSNFMKVFYVKEVSRASANKWNGQLDLAGAGDGIRKRTCAHS